MGTDIHIFVEEKFSGKHWEPMDVPETLLPNDRNYQFFEFLVGIRGGNCKTKFAERGMPTDSSISLDDLDGLHSITHATLHEILKAPWHEHYLEGNYFYLFCNEVLPRLADIRFDKERRKIRLIIGFDS